MRQESTAMYLLVCEEGAEVAIDADLGTEFELQLGSPLAIERVSERAESSGDLGLLGDGPIRALRIDRWSSGLVTLLDTHVIRLERTGAQFLFLTTRALAERLLVEAPNFRNRLAEVLQIVPEDVSGGGAR
jgi:hypothetical protein